MKEWLLEIYSEEIPARMQLQAQKQACQLMEVLLKQYGALYHKVETFIASHRLVVWVQGLENITESTQEVRRGPRLDAPQSALAGFAKATGLSQDQWQQQQGYWYATLTTSGRAIETIIPDCVHAFLDQFSWPKTMRWYHPKTQTFTRPWIRPIRGIVCVYNENPIVFPVSGLDLETGNTTQGHRFLAPHKIVVRDFQTYRSDLEKAFVILDHHQRQQIIEKELGEQAHKIGIKLQANPALLEEVAGLVDHPFVSLGPIDPHFMNLPAVVLSTSMRIHQKYFSFETKEGSLAPYFGLVTHVPLNQDMLQGFRRVLQARLTDAAFFYEVDRKTSLEDLVPQLDGIVFHEKLGSLGQKVQRLERLMTTPEGKQAAHLCKADLLTQMVGEFPELQGMMGFIYACDEGQSLEVVKALLEYYCPLEGEEPKSDISLELSIADRMDSLVGFIGVGIKPTGSKDPFALRRSALETGKILMKDENHHDFDLWPFLKQSVQSYQEQGISLAADTAEQVIKFLNERMIHASVDVMGIPSDVVTAVFGQAWLLKNYNLYALSQKALALHLFLKKPEGQTLKAAYRRTNGILQKDQETYSINADLLQESAEKNLYTALQDLSKECQALILNHHYQGLMHKLSQLRDPIDAFFETVRVNVDDIKVVPV